MPIRKISPRLHENGGISRSLESEVSQVSTVLVVTSRGKYRCPARVMRAFKYAGITLQVVNQDPLVAKGDLRGSTQIRVQYRKFSKSTVEIQV